LDGQETGGTAGISGIRFRHSGTADGLPEQGCMAARHVRVSLAWLRAVTESSRPFPGRLR
jgi:hypothetical protein